MVASTFSPPPSVRDSSSRSSSIARDHSSSTMPSRLEAKAEVHPDEVQQQTKVPSSDEMASPAVGAGQTQVENPTLSSEVLTEPADIKMLGDKQSMDDFAPAAPAAIGGTEGSSPPSTGNGGSNRRRKGMMNSPAKLSERLNSSKVAGPNTQTTEQDPDFYQDWSGGSRYEVDNKPWNILGWLTQGFKNRLQKK
ncbi:unnamed protein product [Phytophthora lilii]|uniref:Unnamed protein product n=1 Tax=Phytophthora lilii TaxID=2077276 RepID=A0A9W6TY88_9STRA|nr:unnamed protein product [Phytophthora lilii]